MQTLSETLFAEGIAELQLFFPKFKPTREQIHAWYNRLKYFTNDQYQVAIYEITEKDAMPNYELIKRKLFEAKRKLNPYDFKNPIAQGYVPVSKESLSFLKDCFSMLYKILDKKNKVEDIQKQSIELKELFNTGYKNLPKYKNKEVIQEMIEAKDWQGLVQSGFMEKIPDQKKSIAIRKFSVSKF